MDKNQFAAFLACALLPMVVQEIQKHTGENAIEVLVLRCMKSWKTKVQSCGI